MLNSNNRLNKPSQDAEPHVLAAASRKFFRGVGRVIHGLSGLLFIAFNLATLAYVCLSLIHI